jgi:hypothetical protein
MLSLMMGSLQSEELADDRPRHRLQNRRQHDAGEPGAPTALFLGGGERWISHRLDVGLHATTAILFA